MLVALEPQCVEISDCVFEGRDQEDIGAGDQVQCLTFNPKQINLICLFGLAQSFSYKSILLFKSQ